MGIQKPPAFPTRIHESHNDELFRTLCGSGQLDPALDALATMDTSPSTSSCMFLLKACNKLKTLIHARHIHEHFMRLKVPIQGLLGEYLVCVLANCGAVDDARLLSFRLPHLSLLSWTAMISAYTECGRGNEALQLHQRMLKEGVEANTRIYICLFKACSSVLDLAQGKKLHAEARIKGLTSDIFVSNTIISMYCKCGAVLDAENTFSALYGRTIVSWNMMLCAYVEQYHGGSALQLFLKMQEEGMAPNTQTLMLMLQACGTLLAKQETCLFNWHETNVVCLEITQTLHAYALKTKLTSSTMLCNTLVSLYGKLGAVQEAEGVFTSLPQHNVVSWTALLSTYIENGYAENALSCYMQMQKEGINPDSVSFVMALQACSMLADKEAVTLVRGIAVKSRILEIAKALHLDACEKGYISDVRMCTALINAYGKCGATSEAENVFDGLSNRDIVLWNAMLSAFVEQGEEEKALCLYSVLLKQGRMLDEVTILHVLRLCSDGTNAEVCKELHFTIVTMDLKSLSLKATLLHTYGRCACIAEAQSVFDEMREPDTVSWTACITGHIGECGTARFHFFERLQMARILPDEVIFSSALTFCSHTGLVFEALVCFESMKRDFSVIPKLMHYGILVDLFGRAGDFKRVSDMLDNMPVQADMAIWWFLLGSCCTHRNLELAKSAFDHAVRLQPVQATAYILMSNAYADAGLYECAKEVNNLRLRLGLQHNVSREPD